MNTIYPTLTLLKKPVTTLFTWLLFLLISSPVFAQLGTYSFTGPGTCPNQNPSVTSQPANAVFSDFTTIGTNCNIVNDIFESDTWNNTAVINLAQYNQFTITPNSGYNLTLDSLQFTEKTSQAQSGATWVIRSSLDGYTTDISSGPVNDVLATYNITLGAPTFTNIGSITIKAGTDYPSSSRLCLVGFFSKL